MPSLTITIPATGVTTTVDVRPQLVLHGFEAQSSLASEIARRIENRLAKGDVVKKFATLLSGAGNPSKTDLDRAAELLSRPTSIRCMKPDAFNEAYVSPSEATLVEHLGLDLVHAVAKRSVGEQLGKSTSPNCFRILNVVIGLVHQNPNEEIWRKVGVAQLDEFSAPDPVFGVLDTVQTPVQAMVGNEFVFRDSCSCETSPQTRMVRQEYTVYQMIAGLIPTPPGLDFMIPSVVHDYPYPG